MTMHSLLKLNTDLKARVEYHARHVCYLGRVYAEGLLNHFQHLLFLQMHRDL